MTDSTGSPAAGGRRERNKLDKFERIFRAASELFDTHGYEGVTTQAVADRADVAAGTVFRYAASKSELLLMVTQRRVAEAVAAGETAARALPAENGIERLEALLLPLLEASIRAGKNTALFQREVLFGAPEGEYRLAALADIERLEATLAALIREHATALGVRPRLDPTLAARTMFSAFQLEVIRVGLGSTPPEALRTDLHAQLGAVLARTLGR